MAELAMTIFRDAATVLGSAILPLAVMSGLLYQLNALLSDLLGSRFGWTAVRWTAWLGTPVHELSHAAVAVLCRHRVVEIQLYRRDARSGVLGFIVHRYRLSSVLQRAGNVPIGLAPLFGGSAAIYFLLVVLISGASWERLVIKVGSVLVHREPDFCQLA